MRWCTTWGNTAVGCSGKAVIIPSSSALPEEHPAFPDTEINDDLAKKICKDLGIPPP